MIRGLLWFDNNKARTLDEKVKRAAEHFVEKYGERPTVCYVHPAHLGAGQLEGIPEDIEMKESNTVLPHHLWIGIK